MMRLLSQMCSWFKAPAGREAERVQELSAAEANELAMLAFLSPLMASNMQAGWAPRLLATDASPFGAGAVATPALPCVMRELWRHRERRGAYAQVFGEWATRLRLLG